MSSHIKNYIENRCEEILKKIGIKKDHVILDFGCGVGNYTIPAAKITGNKGKIYALYESESKLMELSRRVKSAGLNNIKIINTSGKLSFELEDMSADVILLYDIFWYFPLGNSNLSKLLKEVYRVSKANALISVYPEHIEIEKLKQKIEKSGFYLQNRFSGDIIHDGESEKSQILNFRKQVPIIPKA
jgi:ubiquinone/menaquinone biosynthesis C-methylase UbiE